MENSSNSEEPSESLLSKLSIDFKNEAIKEILKTQFTDPKTKISEDAVELVKTVTKVIAVEAAIRAAKQATLENKTVVTIDNVEAILPQIMLDFP